MLSLIGIYSRSLIIRYDRNGHVGNFRTFSPKKGKFQSSDLTFLFPQHFDKKITFLEQNLLRKNMKLVKYRAFTLDF